MINYRFHVQAGQRRTTLSIPKYLLTLFSLKQGFDLTDQETLHKEIRQWCQDLLDKWEMNERDGHFSKIIQKKMIEYLVDDKLSEQYGELILNNEYGKIEF